MPLSEKKSGITVFCRIWYIGIGLKRFYFVKTSFKAFDSERCHIICCNVLEFSKLNHHRKLVGYIFTDGIGRDGTEFVALVMSLWLITNVANCRISRSTSTDNLVPVAAELPVSSANEPSTSGAVNAIVTAVQNVEESKPVSSSLIYFFFFA